ncbi:hypothetical protein [Pseudomonas sp.]|uniref:hypothetical protein n=1 Tax=Pseudomonas sp. TaxID=306 RepID=UPI003D117E34
MTWDTADTEAQEKRYNGLKGKERSGLRDMARVLADGLAGSTDPTRALTVLQDYSLVYAEEERWSDQARAAAELLEAAAALALGCRRDLPFTAAGRALRRLEAAANKPA